MPLASDLRESTLQKKTSITYYSANMCKQIHKIQSYTSVHPYWHLFQLPHDFSINSSPCEELELSAFGVLVRQDKRGIFRCLFGCWSMGGDHRWQRFFSIHLPNFAKWLRNYSNLFESCFVGYFPSVARMRTSCNRTLDLLGFCHKDGLPSHLMCVVRNSVTKHIQCDGTPFLP